MIVFVLNLHFPISKETVTSYLNTHISCEVCVGTALIKVVVDVLLPYCWEAMVSIDNVGNFLTY